MSRQFFSILLILLAIGCGTPPAANTLATYDSGRITKDDLVAFMKSPARPKLRDEAQLEKSQIITQLLRRLATLNILAAQHEEDQQDRDQAQILFLNSETRALLQYYVDTVGKITVEVSDEEAQAHYEELKPTRFTLPEKAKIQYLFLRKDRHHSHEMERLIRNIERDFEKGRPFEELVSKYSESATKDKQGILGPFFRGKLDPEFEAQLFAHATTEKPFVIHDRNGVFFVRFLEYSPGRVMDFEEVKSGVIQDLVNEESTRRRKKLIAEIEKKHRIIIDPEDDNHDGIAIQIDDRSLSADDFQTWLKSNQPASNSKNKHIQADPNKLARNLVDTNLMVLDALDRGLDRDPDFLAREEMSRTISRAAAARVKKFREWVEKIPEEKIKEDFNKNPTRYADPGSYDFSLISVPFTEGDPFTRMQLAESFKEPLASDASDEELSAIADRVGAEYKNLGKISSERALNMGPEISRTLKSMKPGQVSDAIQIKQGFVVLRLKARSPRHQLEFSKDREAIRRHYGLIHRKKIYEEIRNQLLKEHHFKILSTDFELSEDGRARDKVNS